MERILTGKPTVGPETAQNSSSLNILSNASEIITNHTILSQPHIKPEDGGILVIEVAKSDPHAGHGHSQEEIDMLRKHAGHENQHLAMVLILITVTILSQIILVWWKTKYQKSYIHASMIAMYIIPFGISAYRHWWRFVSIWILVTLITLVLVWRPLVLPNFSRSGSAIPRLLYKWFFALYSISSLVAVSGYTILLLTFFGINLLLNISPPTALDIGFMMLFYGIYYGVLCRDFTDFLVDWLAARIGYYNPTSALPNKLLRKGVCAICGEEHGDREDMDMETLNKSDPLLMVDSNGYLEANTEGDQEALVDYSDNSNQRERLFVLSCGHKFHEYCIYGWCLVGKRQVCPFCREKVDLGRLFSALPFQKPHYLYGNLLDFIRYLFAWQPIIFLAVHFLDYELGLE